MVKEDIPYMKKKKKNLGSRFFINNEVFGLGINFQGKFLVEFQFEAGGKFCKGRVVVSAYPEPRAVSFSCYVMCSYFSN